MRRTALLLGAMLAALVALSGVAWALTTIYCSDPQNVYHGTCAGTSGADEIIGTDGADEIWGGPGTDIIRAGRGDDYIPEYDSHHGNDRNYGGPGNDRIWGNLDAERHYGGAGNDTLGDTYTSGDGKPDVFQCGSGYDHVYYNPSTDVVADDCEALTWYRDNP